MAWEPGLGFPEGPRGVGWGAWMHSCWKLVFTHQRAISAGQKSKPLKTASMSIHCPRLPLPRFASLRGSHELVHQLLPFLASADSWAFSLLHDRIEQLRCDSMGLEKNIKISYLGLISLVTTTICLALKKEIFVDGLIPLLQVGL